MFKKKKALILIGAAFILVMLALNFNMVSPGKRIITLKSYDTPQQAFYMQVSAAAVPIEKDLDLVPVDATNALYAAAMAYAAGISPETVRDAVADARVKGRMLKYGSAAGKL